MCIDIIAIPSNFLTLSFVMILIAVCLDLLYLVNCISPNIIFDATMLHTMFKYGFYPSALRPEGYCRCLRPSVCLSVCPSVCPSVRPYDHACPRDNSKNIFQIFSKLAWNILWVNISDKFDDGYRSSLNMRIIDQKVTLTFFEFLK